MKLKLTLIKDNGEEVDYSRQIGELDSSNILKSVERNNFSTLRQILNIEYRISNKEC